MSVKNILVLFADQHRQDCLGCYANPVVQTPALDSLANTGIWFNNAFTPAPVCTPARTCLQTGLAVHDHGVKFNPEFSANGGAGFVDPKIPFFAQGLKNKGYNSAHIGKWHVGNSDEDNPNHPSNYGYDPELPYFYGYGFPAHRGGPMFYADSVGPMAVYDALSRLFDIHGEIFKPAPLLADLAKKGII